MRKCTFKSSARLDLFTAPLNPKPKLRKEKRIKKLFHIS